MPNEEFLNVTNAHSAASGRPPVLRTGEGYISYFEDDRGEQWVFSMDWKSEVFFLAGATLAGKTVSSANQGKNISIWSP